MIKKHKFLFLFILSLLSLSLILFFYIYLFIIPANKIANESNDNSVFKNIDLSYYEKNLTEMRKILTTEDYWTGWSYESKMIEAIILKVESPTNDLVLRVMRPVGKLPQGQKVRASIQCPADSTAMVSDKNPTTSLLEGGFSILDKAQPNDIIYTYCFDENCLNIGKECVLVKRNTINGQRPVE